MLEKKLKLLLILFSIYFLLLNIYFFYPSLSQQVSCSCTEKCECSFSNIGFQPSTFGIYSSSDCSGQPLFYGKVERESGKAVWKPEAQGKYYIRFFSEDKSSVCFSVESGKVSGECEIVSEDLKIENKNRFTLEVGVRNCQGYKVSPAGEDVNGKNVLVWKQTNPTEIKTNSQVTVSTTYECNSEASGDLLVGKIKICLEKDNERVCSKGSFAVCKGCKIATSIQDPVRIECGGACKGTSKIIEVSTESCEKGERVGCVSSDENTVTCDTKDLKDNKFTMTLTCKNDGKAKVTLQVASSSTTTFNVECVSGGGECKPYEKYDESQKKCVCDDTKCDKVCEENNRIRGNCRTDPNSIEGMHPYEEGSECYCKERACDKDYFWNALGSLKDKIKPIKDNPKYTVCYKEDCILEIQQAGENHCCPTAEKIEDCIPDPIKEVPNSEPPQEQWKKGYSWNRMACNGCWYWVKFRVLTGCYITDKQLYSTSKGVTLQGKAINCKGYSLSTYGTPGVLVYVGKSTDQVSNDEEVVYGIYSCKSTGGEGTIRLCLEKPDENQVCIEDKVNCGSAGCTKKEDCPAGMKCVSGPGGKNYCVNPKGFSCSWEGQKAYLRYYGADFKYCGENGYCCEGSDDCGDYSACCKSTICESLKSGKECDTSEDCTKKYCSVYTYRYWYCDTQKRCQPSYSSCPNCAACPSQPLPEGKCNEDKDCCLWLENANYYVKCEVATTGTYGDCKRSDTSQEGWTKCEGCKQNIDCCKFANAAGKYVLCFPGGTCGVSEVERQSWTKCELAKERFYLPFSFSCEELTVGKEATCGTIGECTRGLWIVLNKEGKPLQAPIVKSFSGPSILSFDKNTFVSEGKVKIIGICFSPTTKIISKVLEVKAG